MKWLSISLSVPPFDHSCGRFAAVGLAGKRYQLTAAWLALSSSCATEANAGSTTQSAEHTVVKPYVFSNDRFPGELGLFRFFLHLLQRVLSEVSGTSFYGLDALPIKQTQSMTPTNDLASSFLLAPESTFAGKWHEFLRTGCPSCQANSKHDPNQWPGLIFSTSTTRLLKKGALLSLCKPSGTSTVSPYVIFYNHFNC